MDCDPDERTESALQRRHALIVWLAVLVLLVANVPIFLCQHLTPDAVMFDLQARWALDGTVLYRDNFEPNLPGAVWIHMAVRSIAGTSSMALRAFDLLVVSTIIWLICRLALPKTSSRFSSRTGWTTLALFALYFSLLEWCHCQRDTWMLLPSLLAVTLRTSAVRQMSCSPSPHNHAGSPAAGHLVIQSVLEGCLWGAAFWIKPHITVPALAVFVVSACLVRQTRWTLLSLTGLLTGGLLIGAAGTLWLVNSGAWEAFWITQSEWNSEYVQMGRKRFSLVFLAEIWRWYLPWSCLVLIATGVSFHLFQGLIERTDKTKTSVETNCNRSISRKLVTALFCGWLLQALLLQQPFAYVFMPVMILATAVSFGIPMNHQWRAFLCIGLAAFTLMVCTSTLATSPQRLKHWMDCIREGSSLRTRALIQIQTLPDWSTIEPVLEHLRELRLADGELTVYPGTLVSVYHELGLKPSTRFACQDWCARLYSSRVADIEEALRQSNHRFVVSSLRDAGLSPEQIAERDDPDTGLPISFPTENFDEFPYTQPVIFRSGQYCIHRVTGPIGRLSTEYFPLRRSMTSPKK